MRETLRALALTVPVVFGSYAVAGSLDYDPQTLTIAWPDHVERIAATSRRTCEDAVRAVRLGLWHPGEDVPVTASCAPGNLFAPGSECIAGLNCRGRQ